MAALALFVGALIYYLLGASPFVQGGDTGEFATLAAVGGVAHPPGYPLSTFLTHYVASLFTDNGALRASLVSAACGAGSVAGLFVAARWWGASLWAAALGAAALAGSSLMWELSTSPEVFALNQLIAVWILAYSCPDRANIPVLGLLAGLGIANHHSIVLLASIGLYGVWRAAQGSKSKLHLGMGAGLLLGGAALPYLLLLNPTADQFAFVSPSSLEELWGVFTRRQYGTFRLSTHGEPEPITHMTIMLGGMLREGGWLLPLLAPWALWLHRKRWDVRWLFAATLLTGPLFATLFTMDLSEPVVHARLERFVLLPLAPLLLLGTLSATELLSHLKKLPAPAVIAPMALVFFLLGGVRDHRPIVENYVRDTLNSLPPNAVLLGSGDHRTFGFIYGLQGLGLRPDVDYVRFSRVADPVRLVKSLLEKNERPVFLGTVYGPLKDAQVPGYPFGTVIRALPPGEGIPPPQIVEARNLDLFAKFELPEVPPEEFDLWERDIAESYASPWYTLVRAYEAAGDAAGAARCRERVGHFAPWVLSQD